MRILILGGTVFLGRHIADTAVAAGHEVTLFHRGLHPAAHPAARELIGDRDGDDSALAGEKWDAVIDTSGYVPRVVAKTLKTLQGNYGWYCFVSSISVYEDMSASRLDENSATLRLDVPGNEDINENYGALKALCEAEVAASAHKAFIVRPGLIAGPWDPSDRFTYWPVRFHRGGRILYPAHPDTYVQFIDVRDLAEWIVACAERGITGVYNATGPEKPLSFSAFIAACSRAVKTECETVGVNEEFLRSEGVLSWTDMPMWIAKADNMTGFSAADCSAAYANGLRHRDVDLTLKDTLEWRLGQEEQCALKWGISPEREGTVLGKWQENI